MFMIPMQLNPYFTLLTKSVQTAKQAYTLEMGAKKQY